LWFGWVLLIILSVMCRRGWKLVGVKVAKIMSGPAKVASTIAGGALLGIYKLAERKKKIQAEESK
jgi:hypothetical protein